MPYSEPKTRATKKDDQQTDQQLARFIQDKRVESVAINKKSERDATNKNRVNTLLRLLFSLILSLV
jgi:hypothetical protein